MPFEPFLDRLSRDIRNALASTMTDILINKDIGPAQKVAHRYLELDIDPCYQDYINSRLAIYRLALEQLTGGPDDVFWQSLVLWDHRLFFEVHEVLEHAWKESTEPEKKIYQAMIRAAGVYIKMEYGYTEAAGKIAEKALLVLEQNKVFLGRYFEPEKLIQALKECDPVPPHLLD